MTLAQLRNPVLPPLLGQGGTEQGGRAIGQLISNIVAAMFLLGFFVALLYLITGAFHWITSGGDKANLESARNKIIHALIGLIVLASAWAFTTLTASFVGLDFTRLPIPTIPSQ